MKIYQVVHVSESRPEITSYVGLDKDKAFSYTGTDAKISVWVHGNEVEEYVRVDGEWSLKFSAIDSMEKEVAELNEYVDKLKRQLESRQKIIDGNKQILAVLKSE